MFKSANSYAIGRQKANIQTVFRHSEPGHGQQGEFKTQRLRVT